MQRIRGVLFGLFVAISPELIASESPLPVDRQESAASTDERIARCFFPTHDVQVALASDETPVADEIDFPERPAEEYYGDNYYAGSDQTGGWTLLSLQSSDPRFDDFISPMSNPVYFEDPRTLSEARFIFLNHKVPNPAGGGDVQLYALQIRAALTDRLSLIATKDGYIVSENPLIDDGWADIAAGLKYNLFSDPYAQQLLSAGIVYEAPSGTHDALQGNGDGAFDFFLTGGAQICCRGHWLAAGGLVQPVNTGDESTWSYLSNHFDYYMGNGFYALMEYNWYHYLKSGDGGIPGVEGGDLFNFGSTGVAGNDIVTCAFGTKFKPDRCTEIGLAWEVPLTERRDVMENRLTFDVIRRF